MANRRTTTETKTQNPISRWPIPLYVPVFIKLTWGHRLSRADLVIHYSLLIWYHIGTKGVSFNLKTIFLYGAKQTPWG